MLCALRTPCPFTYEKDQQRPGQLLCTRNRQRPGQLLCTRNRQCPGQLLCTRNRHGVRKAQIAAFNHISVFIWPQSYAATSGLIRPLIKGDEGRRSHLYILRLFLWSIGLLRASPFAKYACSPGRFDNRVGVGFCVFVCVLVWSA
jgi:hypothetical protein